MEQPSFVQEGIERFRGAFESLDDEFQRVQKRVQARRKALEKQLRSGRRDLERQTRKQVKRIQTEARKSPLYKRAVELQSDAAKVLEKGFDRVLGALQIASRSDVDRIDRKLNSISRKLKEIERTKGGNGEVATV